MIISKDDTFHAAEIYPFADTEEEARRQKRISVRKDGSVFYNGRIWTKQEILDYTGQLLVGFAKAFEIAERIANADL